MSQKQIITTTGLVLRVTKTGESDRVIHILTHDHGMISAIAKGSMRLKSKLFSSTGLFCYSEFTLFAGKNLYIVNEAEVKQVFFNINEDIESLALAMYIAELAGVLLHTDDESDLQLRLILNTFYFLSNKNRSVLLLKIIFELRTMCTVGYLPDLVACSDCMCYNAKEFFFDTSNGVIYCSECAKKLKKNCNLSMAEVSAMRHIAYCEDSELFNFTLVDERIKNLLLVVEQYCIKCIDRQLKTLDFLHTALE